LLNLGSLFFPLAFSFDKKVHFYTCWWRLFPAMLVGAASFLIWDEWFTQMQVWHFNPKYITGIYLGHLPLEEWMFFFFIPYACMFIYENLRVYFLKYIQRIPVIIFQVIGGLLIAFFISLAVLYRHHIYTFITFTGCAIMLSLFLLIFRFRYFPLFFCMWIVHLIPLFLVNGVLTALPVVIYNDAENMGVRIGTVPFEDSFYSMLLLLINITVYELLGQWRTKKSTTPSISR
jgi:lycopene cyclase domain-containing protein